MAHPQPSQIFVALTGCGFIALILGGWNMLIWPKTTEQFKKGLDGLNGSGLRGSAQVDFYTRKYLFYGGLVAFPIGVLGMVFRWFA